MVGLGKAAVGVARRARERRAPIIVRDVWVVWRFLGVAEVATGRRRASEWRVVWCGEVRWEVLCIGRRALLREDLVRAQLLRFAPAQMSDWSVLPRKSIA